MKFRAAHRSVAVHVAGGQGKGAEEAQRSTPDSQDFFQSHGPPAFGELFALLFKLHVYKPLLRGIPFYAMLEQRSVSC